VVVGFVDLGETDLFPSLTFGDGNVGGGGGRRK